MPTNIPAFQPPPAPRPADLTIHADPEEEVEVVTFHEAPRAVENRHIQPKRIAKTGTQVAGVGLSAAQMATNSAGTFTTLGLVAGGAAVAATPLGLAAGAAVLTVASSALSVKSATSTARHITGLQKIYDGRASLAKDCAEIHPSGDEGQTKFARASHDIVADQVLPYAINKKEKKLIKKIAGAIPGVSLVATAIAIEQRREKTLDGTRGVNRTNAAKWLATHFLTCSCILADSVVAELLSVTDVVPYKFMNFGELCDLLERKLSSTGNKPAYKPSSSSSSSSPGPSSGSSSSAYGNVSSSSLSSGKW